MNRNIKKIVSSCLLASMSISLVACDDNIGNGGNNKTLDGGHKVAAKINDISDVWFNIPDHDSHYDGGRTSFLVNNETNHDLSLVGCDSSSGFNYSKMNYKSESATPIAIDDVTGKVLPVSKQGNNTMELNVNRAKDGTGYCYYKLHLYDMNKDLFVKLALTKDNFSTQSSIFQSVDRPYNEMEDAIRAQEHGWFRPVIDSVLPVTTAGATFSGVYWMKKLSASAQERVKNAVIDKVFNDVVDAQKAQFDAVNEELARIRNLPGPQQDAAYRELLADLRVKGDEVADGPGIFEKYPNERALANLKKTSKFQSVQSPQDPNSYSYAPLDAEGNYVGTFRGNINPGDGKDWWTVSASDMRNELSNPYGSFYNERKVLMEKLKPEELPHIIDSNFFARDIQRWKYELPDGRMKFFGNSSGYAVDSIKYELKKKALGAKIVPDAIEKSSLGKSLIAVERNSDHVVEYVYKGADEVAERLAKRAAVSATISSTGVGLAVEAITWFGIQPALSMLFFPAATGEFSTDLLYGKLTVPSQDDVNNWNSSHPTNKIAYTTAAVGDDHNTYSQTLNISPIATGSEVIDKSAMVQINLEAYTTPFKRTMTGGKDDYDDRITTQTDGNSVFMLSLTSPNGRSLATRDLSVDVMNQLFNSAGYHDLLPVLLPKPEVVSTKNVAYTGNLTSFLQASPGALNSSGGSNGLKTTRVGNIQGLFIKPNEMVTLGLRIPDNANNDGNGYSLTYVPNTAFENNNSANYKLVKSSSYFDEKSALGANVLLAAFDKPVPYKLNDVVNLNMAISDGGKSGLTSSGRLYVGDNLGNTTAIPVYLNYALLAEPKSLDAKHGSKTANFTIANVSNKKYDSLSITGLPTGAKVTTANATAALAPNEQRQITLDLSQMDDDFGNYSISITGNSSSKSLNDNQTVALSVSEAL